MAFSSNLRYLRKKYSLSQDDLAEKLGYKSFTTIQKWESGVSEPSMSVVKQLSIMFNITMDELMNIDLETESTGSSNSSSTAPLAPQEEEIIDIFRALNDEGQHRLIEYGDDLVASGRYIKSGSDRLVEEA